MTQTAVSRTVTAQNQFTDSIRIANKTASLSIASTAISATIVLQRKLPEEDSTKWRDVASFTANAEKIIDGVGVWDYRIGCKTGGFTSATALTVAIVA